MGRRILVCGSRDWEDVASIRAALVDGPAKIHPTDTVIHGGSRGADKIAGMLARELGATVETYPADWRLNGRKAGPIRNVVMLNTKPHLVIAFHKDDSRGTAHVIREARARKIPLIVFQTVPRRQTV
jgi:YspA, cpYpsA-related SLOG family